MRGDESGRMNGRNIEKLKRQVKELTSGSVDVKEPCKSFVVASSLLVEPRGEGEVLSSQSCNVFQSWGGAERLQDWPGCSGFCRVLVASFVF